MDQPVFSFGCQDHQAKTAKDQGCQIVYFQTKDPNWGKFWNFSSFGTFFPVQVSCTKKNLATLQMTPFQATICCWLHSKQTRRGKNYLLNISFDFNSF
jgi:hypothetical protein